ncbi:MAG TPA: PilZ domain-containing protein [Candidatus Hydrogenedentes bacterium]|nr:PilZ domain-containing protein [Candidatus Hydrogenedentota bacterium]HPG66670.1 PilZ domain-containing protein [Candidatus Hydrogenedentota bacterium]
MADDMILSSDEKSLHRGRRKSPRTATCRPCLVWVTDNPEEKLKAVVMDLSPHGMRLRMIEILPTDTAVSIQMMRDDDFQVPLSVPTEGVIVRYESMVDGFTDHGVQLVRTPIERLEPRAVNLPSRATLPPRTAPRMHTIDFTVGGQRGTR